MLYKSRGVFLSEVAAAPQDWAHPYHIGIRKLNVGRVFSEKSKKHFTSTHKAVMLL